MSFEGGSPGVEEAVLGCGSAEDEGQADVRSRCP